MKVILPLVLLLTLQVQCNLICLSDYDLGFQKAAAQNMGDVAHHHHHSESDQEDSHHGNGTDCKHPGFDNAENVQSFTLIHAITQAEAPTLSDFAVSTLDNELSRVAADFHSPPLTTDTQILSLRI
jgi:hypothetical protein